MFLFFAAILMRAIGPRIASNSSQNNNNHKNSTDSCNDDDEMISISSCTCFKKKVKRVLSIAEI